MNGLEIRFYLQALENCFIGSNANQFLGTVIHSVSYQPFALNLADRTTYTPDFMLDTDRGVYLVETKGFMRDDANVKLKVAAELFPAFQFWLAELNNRKWTFTRIPREKGEVIKESMCEWIT